MAMHGLLMTISVCRAGSVSPAPRLLNLLRLLKLGPIPRSAALLRRIGRCPAHRGDAETARRGCEPERLAIQAPMRKWQPRRASSLLTA